MQVRYFANTMSGVPGNLLTLILYLYPRLWSLFRSRTSGFVFRDLMCDMQVWRCIRVKQSDISLHPQYYHNDDDNTKFNNSIIAEDRITYEARVKPLFDEKPFVLSKDPENPFEFIDGCPTI